MEDRQSSKKFVENEAFWQHHYSLLKASELSRVDYCRENNLNYDQFGYRISKWNKSRPIENNELVSVKLKPMNESLNSSTLCTLDLKNGYSLRIHDSEALMIILEKFY